MEEIGAVVALAELVLESLGKPVNDALAVVGPLPACLLFLDDDAADFPIGFDHGGVDRLPGPVPGRGEDLADLAVERVEVRVGRISLAGLGTARRRLGRRLLGWVAFLCHAVGITQDGLGGEPYCSNSIP